MTVLYHYLIIYQLLKRVVTGQDRCPGLGSLPDSSPLPPEMTGTRAEECRMSVGPARLALETVAMATEQRRNSFGEGHGVTIIEAADVAPGPTSSVYAFSRETTQRNLYRIPVP